MRVFASVFRVVGNGDRKSSVLKRERELTIAWKIRMQFNATRYVEKRVRRYDGLLGASQQKEICCQK